MNILVQIRSHGIRTQLTNKRKDLYRIALAWAGDPMLADDLTQEAMTRALTNLHQLENQDKLEHWMFRILNNCWREHLRRARPTVDLDGLVLTSGNTPETGLRRQQVVARVRAAIGTLPLGQRQVVTLVDIQGFSYKEVAKVLEIPVGTVMSRLNRARKSLKDKLLTLQGELSPQRCHVRRVK